MWGDPFGIEQWIERKVTAFDQLIVRYLQPVTDAFSARWNLSNFRFAQILFSVAGAIKGCELLTYIGHDTRGPYLHQDFLWNGIIIGGLIFACEPLQRKLLNPYIGGRIINPWNEPVPFGMIRLALTVTATYSIGMFLLGEGSDTRLQRFLLAVSITMIMTGLFAMICKPNNQSPES